MAEHPLRSDDEDPPDKATARSVRPLTPGQREAQQRDVDREREAQREEAERRQKAREQERRTLKPAPGMATDAQRKQAEDAERDANAAAAEAAKQEAFREAQRQEARRNPAPPVARVPSPEAPPVETPPLAAMTLPELYDYLETPPHGTAPSLMSQAHFSLDDVLPRVQAAIRAQAPDYQELACRLLLALGEWFVLARKAEKSEKP